VDEPLTHLAFRDAVSSVLDISCGSTTTTEIVREDADHVGEREEQIGLNEGDHVLVEQVVLSEGDPMSLMTHPPRAN